MIRLLLADDHSLIRAGIRVVLSEVSDIEVIGEAADGTEVQHLCKLLAPDVLLLDLQMPGPSATETIQTLRAQMPMVRVIVLTAYDDDVYVRSVQSIGVSGYVLKDEADEVIVIAIRAVMIGIPYYSQAIITKLASSVPSIKRVGEPQQLTDREILLLQLLTQGKTNQELSFALDVKEKTIEKYLHELYIKLSFNSRVDAAVWAVRNGLC